MKRRTMTEIVNHNKSTTLELSIKTSLWGLNRFYVATTLVLSSAVVYTRHLFSTREGFLVSGYLMVFSFVQSVDCQ